MYICENCVYIWNVCVYMWNVYYICVYIHIYIYIYTHTHQFAFPSSTLHMSLWKILLISEESSGRVFALNSLIRIIFVWEKSIPQVKENFFCIVITCTCDLPQKGKAFRSLIISIIVSGTIMCFIIEVDFVLALKNLFAILGSGSTFGRRAFKYTFKLKYWWWYSGKPLEFLLCVFLFSFKIPFSEKLVIYYFLWYCLRKLYIHQILIY